MRARRFTGSAAVLAAAALIGSLAGVRRERSGPDPALEARVLVESIAALERRLTVDPGNPLVSARLVSDHMAAFQLDNDLDHLRRALTLSEALVPTALDRGAAHARVASARLSLHDFGGALSAARAAIAADPTGAAALGTLYDAAIAAGSYREAERALEALVESHPGTLGATLREARWLETHGAADEALARLAPLCRRLSGRAVRRQLVAWCETIAGGLAGAAGDPGAAAAWYERALDTQPGYPPALEGQADLAYARSEWTRADALYRRILTDAHPDLCLRLAEVRRALGDERGARAFEDRFLALVAAPEARALQAHDLALLLAGMPDRRDEALAVIERDVASRRSVEALEVLAWVRLARGDLTEALAASIEARAWGEPDATSDYTQARILAGMGREEEVRSTLDRALADPAVLAPHARWEAVRHTRALRPAAEAADRRTLSGPSPPPTSGARERRDATGTARSTRGSPRA